MKRLSRESDFGFDSTIYLTPISGDRLKSSSHLVCRLRGFA